MEQLKEAGCEAIYKEIAGGARSDREQLKTLLKGLRPGSTLVVTRLDRLARSTVDLLTTIKAIADRGCLFKSARPILQGQPEHHIASAVVRRHQVTHHG